MTHSHLLVVCVTLASAMMVSQAHAQALPAPSYLSENVERQVVGRAINTVSHGEAMLISSSYACLTERPEPMCESYRHSTLEGPRLTKKLWGRILVDLIDGLRFRDRPNTDSPLVTTQRPIIDGDTARFVLVVQRKHSSGVKDSVVYGFVFHLLEESPRLVSVTDRPLTILRPQ